MAAPVQDLNPRVFLNGQHKQGESLPAVHGRLNLNAENPVAAFSTRAGKSDDPKALGNPGEDVPVNRQLIDARQGQIDAVSGELMLRMPLGPRLPGRIPLGFTYAFDSQNPFHDQLAGDFRPVVWPGTSLDGLSFTVILEGQPITFPRSVMVQDGPSFNSRMSRVGGDDGSREAADAVANLNKNNMGASYRVGRQAVLQHMSLDGERYFYYSWWTIVKGNDKPETSNYFAGQRMMMVEGENTLWTDCKGRTFWHTEYGDRVTITETDVTYNEFPPIHTGGDYKGGKIIIQNDLYKSHTITMLIQQNRIEIQNDMGLPKVEIEGALRLRQRTNRQTGAFESLYDYGFMAKVIRETASNGENTETQFEWTQKFIGPVNGFNNNYRPPIKEIKHSNGMIERFTYEVWPYRRLGDYAFSQRNGAWIGFHPNPNFPVWGSNTSLVTQFVQEDGAGNGRCVKFVRTRPDWNISASGGNPWKQTEHQTLIESYGDPKASQSARKIRLTHFGYGGPTGSGAVWGGPDSSEQDRKAAYLFATSAVKRAEWLDTSSKVYRAVDYSDYSFCSILNPQDQVVFNVLDDGFTKAVSLPMVPTCTRTVMKRPGLPTQTTQLKDFKFNTFQRQETRLEMGTTAITHRVDKVYGRLEGLGKIVLTSEKAALQSSVFSSLRKGVKGSELVLGQVDFQHDASGRLLEKSLKVGRCNRVDNYVYSGRNPIPDQTSLAMEGWVEVLRYSHQVGVSNAFEGAPFYHLESESDRLTGLKTSYDRDPLGRVIRKTEPSSMVWEMAYDAWGRLASEKRLPKGTVNALEKRYSFDPKGRWQREEILAEGRTLVTRTDLDAWGRAVRVERPDGFVQTIRYNGFGEKIAESPWMAPSQSAYGDTRYFYDGKGRLTEIKDPQGRVIMSSPKEPVWSEAHQGVISASIDDRGFETTVCVDLLGQRRKIINPKKEETLFEYDALGRLAEVIQGTQKRRYVHDDLGFLIEREDPEEGRIQYNDYTVLGKALETTREGVSGNNPWSLRLGMDEKGRVVSMVDNLGSLDQTLEYDTEHPTQVKRIKAYQTHGRLEETYGYDAMGRLVEKRIEDDKGAEFTVRQNLDALGNPTSIYYPSGDNIPERELKYAYDSFLRPLSATLGGLRAQAVYDKVSGSSLSEQLDLGNGASTRKTWDKGDWTRIEHRLGNRDLEIASLRMTLGGLLLEKGLDRFEYDELSRLKGSKVYQGDQKWVHQVFDYDRWGNRISTRSTASEGTRLRSLVNWQGTFGADNRLPQSLRTDRGDCQTGALYDEFGRLATIWAVPGLSESQCQYHYDAQGRVVTENGHRFLLDGEGLRFRRQTPDGAFQYVVYGFNREPLCTFKIPAKPKARAKSQAGAQAGQGVRR